jgi:hypothetical protein
MILERKLIPILRLLLLQFTKPMKLPKKELAEMLINCNEYLEALPLKTLPKLK